MAFCINCGTKLDEGINFCLECGTPVEAASAGTPAPSAPPPLKAASPAVPPPKAESPADAYVLPVPRDAVKLTKEMVEPPPASFKGHLVIPEGIQVIEFLAFSFGFEGIDIIELTLPESLKKMEEFEPQGLKKITTGAGVQFDLYPDFQKAYTEIYGSAAGTYILKGDTWEQV